MVPVLKKAMIYLGLGPDEIYEDYPAQQRDRNRGLPRRHEEVNGLENPTTSMGPRSSSGTLAAGRTVHPIPLNPDGSYGQPGDPADRQNRSQDSRYSPMRGVISRKPHAVSPEGFNDAQEIADRLKSGQAVIINLQSVNRDLRRRLVDFSSGLCYGRDGKMDRVADQVYLLTPADLDSVSRGGTQASR